MDKTFIMNLLQSQLNTAEDNLNRYKMEQKRCIAPDDHHIQLDLSFHVKHYSKLVDEIQEWMDWIENARI